MKSVTLCQLLATMLLLSVTPPSFGQLQPRANAVKQTHYFKPASVLELPPSVASALQRKGCLIPKQQANHGASSVITGEFYRKGQKDWAVLCSIHHVTSIVIFSGGPERAPETLSPVQDRRFFSRSPQDATVYLRSIQPVDRDFIEKHQQTHGGNLPKLIDHQGINEDLWEKASIIWYNYRGKWLQLTGSD